MCAGPYKTERLPLPDQGVFTPVGELHLERAWSGDFAYATTRSTSFQVGVRPEGGNWGVGGSTSSLKQGTSEAGNDIGLTEHHMYTFAADIDYVRTAWRCTRGDNWYAVEMVEPASWRGGLRRTDFGPPPGCDRSKTSPVPPTGYFRRGKSESTTMEGAINVAGFRGAVTTTVSEGVRYGWRNQVNHERHLCGERNYINTNTRISSLP